MDIIIEKKDEEYHIYRGAELLVKLSTVTEVTNFTNSYMKGWREGVEIGQNLKDYQKPFRLREPNITWKK